MKVYRLRPNGFKEVRNQIIVKSACIGLLALAVGIGISVYRSDGPGGKMDGLPLVMGITLSALAFGLYKGIKRQKTLYQSIIINISESEITSEQLDRSAITIPFNDIKSIIKAGNGSLAIRGSSSLNIIIIPAQIENYEQLVISLNEIRPFDKVKGTAFGQAWLMATILLTMISMATLYISTNKILVGISGTLLIGLFIWSFVVTQKSKMVDVKTKRGSYFTFFLLLVVVVIMVTKLAGN